MFFSKNLILFMERYQITSKRLGEMVNLTDGAIQSYRKGRAFPSMAVVFKLKDIFKVDLESFFFKDLRNSENYLLISNSISLPDKLNYEDLSPEKFNKQSVDEAEYKYATKISKEENLYRELITGRDREIEVLNELIKYLKSQIEDLKK